MLQIINLSDAQFCISFGTVGERKSVETLKEFGVHEKRKWQKKGWMF